MSVWSPPGGPEFYLFTLRIAAPKPVDCREGLVLRTITTFRIVAGLPNSYKFSVLRYNSRKTTREGSFFMSIRLIRFSLLIAGTALLLTGCGKSMGPYPYTPKGSRNWAWYENHPKQDKEQALWCHKAIARWRAKHLLAGQFRISKKHKYGRALFDDCRIPWAVYQNVVKK